MEIKLSVFFILMLVQTAISVPVDKNSETKDVMATSDYLELLKTSNEINNKLKDLLDELPYLKLDEADQKFIEWAENLFKRNAAIVKAEADDILNDINSAETKKELQDIFDEFSEIKLVETSKNLTERLANLVKQVFANVKANADDILNHINLAETKKKLQDILDALSNINLVNIYKNFEQQSKNFAEHEISVELNNFPAVLKQINSAKTKSKLEVVIEHFSAQKFFETSKNFNKLFINFFEQELSGVKAKVDAILNEINQINSAQAKEK